jgi:hypothetical protein
MIRLVVVLICLICSGCAYRVATTQYGQGFLASPLDQGRYQVRYSGKGLESQRALEKLLRRGVLELCGNEHFRIDDLSLGTEDVMHRSDSHYRFVDAVATCSQEP